MKKVFLILILIFSFSCSSKKSSNEITIALDWVPNTNHTGLYVAKELGYFKEQGLDVDIVQPAEDSSSTIVATGKAQFGIYFQPNLAKRLQKDMPITAVAAILSHNTAGIMALDDGTVKSPVDLANKRYSSWEDKIDDATVMHLVKSKNLNIIPSETTDAAAALSSNLFDYILVYYGWDGINANLKGVKTKFFYFKDYEPAFDYYSPIIIANNEFLEKDPEIAKKALKAISKGYEYASQNPEKAADILIKYAPETDENLIRESQKYLSKYYLSENGKFGYIDIDRWNRFYAFLYKEGLTDKNLENIGVTNEYLPK